jgi:hypothetical protein
MNTRHLIGWIALIVLGLGEALPASVGAQEAIQAIRVQVEGPLVDPEAAFWKGAQAVQVTMVPQIITTPMNLSPAINSLTVKAAHNGQWVAILLEWKDPTKSDRIMLDEFGDQVAVELPVHYKKDALPSPMMGNPGGRVNTWQWRAAFQHDIEHGEPQIRDLYPNARVDLYPDQVLRAIDARPYMGALGVDNPISRPRHTPVLDQMAEGWGTMTVQPEQNADGKGVWKDGVWRVVITHPLVATTENQPRLQPGGETVIAFAVWDGGNREVGSRKAWSPWIPFTLAK